MQLLYCSTDLALGQCAWLCSSDGRKHRLYVVFQLTRFFQQFIILKLRQISCQQQMYVFYHLYFYLTNQKFITQTPVAALYIYTHTMMLCKCGSFACERGEKEQNLLLASLCLKQVCCLLLAFYHPKHLHLSAGCLSSGCCFFSVMLVFLQCYVLSLRSHKDRIFLCHIRLCQVGISGAAGNQTSIEASWSMALLCCIAVC